MSEKNIEPCSQHCTKKWSFPFKMSSVNVTKSAVSCGFGNIYWRNPEWKTLFFLHCRKLMTGKYFITYLKTFIISQTLKPLGFLYFGFVIVHNPVSPWNEQKRDHWGAVNASKNETIEARQPVLKLDLSLHPRQGFWCFLVLNLQSWGSCDVL